MTESILERLLAESQEIPGDDRVPYAFEKRIMAHIKEAPPATSSVADAWLAWSQSLWKAVVPCLAVLVMVAVWMKAPADGSDVTTPPLQGNGAPTIANFATVGRRKKRQGDRPPAPLVTQIHR